MTRSEKIEEAARALLDGSEGIKLNAGTAEVMNYWNRYRGLRADLRAALSTPAPDGGDAYRRGEAWHAGHGTGYRQGVEDAARVADDTKPCGCQDYCECCTCSSGPIVAAIRALAPAPGAATGTKEEA